MEGVLEAASIGIHWDSAAEMVEFFPERVTVENEYGDVHGTPDGAGTGGSGSTVRERVGAEPDGEKLPGTAVLIGGGPRDAGTAIGASTSLPHAERA